MIADDAADPEDGARTVELPPLPDTTILLAEVGSTAHGTGIPGGEDYDRLGVVVETPDEQLASHERDERRATTPPVRPARAGLPTGGGIR